MTTAAPDMEAEYNNRARVPEHPAVIEGWARDAAAWRQARAECRLDIPYGPHPRQRYDFFPGGVASRCVVFIHGGYWQALDKSFFSHMAAGANAHGFDVAIPSYRLCPEVSLADIVDDMTAFCAALGAAGHRHIVASGHSAGGHLSACLLSKGRIGSARIEAALSISGLFDLAPLVGTTINAPLRLTEESARAQSPLLWPPPVPGTAMIAFVGDGESMEYQRQSRVIAEAWSTAGLRAQYRQIAGADHFTAIASLALPDGELTQALAGLAAG